MNWGGFRMATIDELERRLEDLDRRESIDNEIQNQEFAKIHAALNQMGGSPFWKSSRFLIAALTIVASSLTSVAGILPPEFGAVLSGIVGAIYMGLKTLDNSKNP